ncbi:MULTISPECIES: phage tail protein [unclassified Coleofasciculus]|uniref:phage tail protein n=1 Tax=unclassified Coleofasciculus TaxID=2692782 RepID=UPI00187FC8BE|nr:MULTISPECIES: phage tail protein [unclassified Coleofasciculus]MBE9126983.1 phage tail protein [Coleofasciculus sp. LEGE 07081]MBE9150334.1 phage tail protein [Coleofasciculus sp. LEGE 07092]
MAEAELLTPTRYFLELSLDGSNDSVDALFKECSGFKATQDTIEVCEVTPQKWGKNGSAPHGRVVRTKVPGNITYTNLTLKRGLNVSMTLWNWLNSVQEGANWAEQRRNGALILYDTSAKEKFRFEFKGAWPVSYTISDLSIEGEGYEIEEVEVAIEELIRIKAGS